MGLQRMQVGVSTHCGYSDSLITLCRKSKDADPTNWASRKYEYSGKTSTTSLRPHIERHHLDKFNELAAKHGWKILLPGLVSQARSQATEASEEGDRRDNFNEQTFRESLLNFVIADDQVLYLYLVFI